MKKHFTAALLAACFLSPAFAAAHAPDARTADTRVHRSAVALCALVLIGLHGRKKRREIEERTVTIDRREMGR